MTPDQLQQIIDRMTTGPWRWSQGSHRDATLYLESIENDATVLSCVCSRHDGDSVFPEDQDMEGILQLRNHATALVECAKLLKECREPCPISEDGLNDLRERVDAAQRSALAELNRAEAKMVAEADYHANNKGEDKTALRALEADYNRALDYARSVGVRV